MSHTIPLLFLLTLFLLTHSTPYKKNPHPKHPLKSTFLERASKCSRTRTISGYCTHPLFKWMGMAGRPLGGWYEKNWKKYGWNIGKGRRGAREISNILFRSGGDKRSRRRVSEFANCFSQFIDHVFVHVDVDKKDRMDIPVPNGDTTFGSKPLTFSRSKRISHGFRKNLIENALSSYVDASNVYGHTFERAKRLRLFKDGLLKTKDNALDNAYLPYNDVKLPNAPNPNLTRLFLGGDVRANEQPNLLVLHTIWLREHNLIALELKKNVGSHWDDEKLYQSARSIVIAEMQKVTYDEMIPAFLGGFKDIALGKYEGWKWWVNPTVSNFFTTGSFRLGHSMVNDNLTVLSEGNTRRRRIDMRNHFWNPKIVTELGVEPFLRGMAKTNTQECDIEMSPSLRNFLFNKVPEAAGVDLAAINIQRGREHGTPDYNSMRRHFGLRPRRSFSEITKDQRVARMLKRAYNGDINNVDPWVAGLAEDHVGGGSMGELFRASWIDEFRRMRDGDRLWYQQYDRVFTKELQEKSQHVKDVMNDNLTMKDIVVRNSNVARNDLQDNLFIVS